MRRRGGNGLVKNELRVLLAACEMLVESVDRFHGYELALRLKADAGGKALMTQPTLYRCLRRLEERGALVSEWEDLEDAAADGRDHQPRRYYKVTESGVATARQGLRQLNVGWSDRHLRVLESGSA